METETYLGDGLYAKFDGYGIELRAPREHGDHIVYLEPPVWDNLVQWRAALIKAAREATKASST